MNDRAPRGDSQRDPDAVDGAARSAWWRRAVGVQRVWYLSVRVGQGAVDCRIRIKRGIARGVAGTVSVCFKRVRAVLRAGPVLGCVCPFDATWRRRRRSRAMLRSHTRAAATPKTVAFHQHACWTAPLQINLALENEQFTIQQRCGIRYAAHSRMQKVASGVSAGGGITEDGGLRCGDTHLNFELRVKREVKGSSSIRASWIKLQPTAGQPCTQQTRKLATVCWQGDDANTARPDQGFRARSTKAQGRLGPAIAPSVALQLGSHTSGMPVSSSRHCVGRCCSTRCSATVRAPSATYYSSARPAA